MPEAEACKLKPNTKGPKVNAAKAAEQREMTFFYIFVSSYSRPACMQTIMIDVHAPDGLVTCSKCDFICIKERAERGRQMKSHQATILCEDRKLKLFELCARIHRTQQTYSCLDGSAW